jgi:hypothetical protein
LTQEYGGPGLESLAPCYGGDGPSGTGLNCFSLQLNSEIFTCNTPYTGGVTVTAYQNSTYVSGCWQQFVYSNEATGVGSTYGSLFIQYWLINYCDYSGGSFCSSASPVFSCPALAPAGGWIQFYGSCYANGNSITNIPRLSATDLGKLTLTGTASYATTGNALIMLSIAGGASYSINSDPAGILNLKANWVQSEFNVVGDNRGSQAVFNDGTSIEVSNALSNPSGPIASTCTSGGTTGETNNLFLQSCTGSGSGISFIECISGTGTSTCSTTVLPTPEFGLAAPVVAVVGLLAFALVRKRTLGRIGTTA